MVSATMRPYAANSPSAAARIIALTVVADGDISQPEIDLLESLGVHDQLGLERQALHEVFDAFCEDLLLTQQLRYADVCPVDEPTLAALMADISDPALRMRLLGLCVALAESDDRVAEGEQIVLKAAVKYWGLRSNTLQSTGPQT